MASAAAKKGQEPPKKKRKKEPILNPSLPDDVILTCLARVPRLYHPNLSLVSKSFRSFLASPELYLTRTLLGCTEIFLYVCLRFPDESDSRWFVLHRNPYQTLSNRNTESSRNLLAPIPVLNSPPPVEWSDLIAVGSSIYAIGADIKDGSCCNVSFIDCRTHTWVEAPCMRLAHTHSSYDGKTYLPGSCEKTDSLNCVELYNTKTQTWNPVPPEKRMFELTNLQGKIFITSERLSGVALKAKDLTWEALGSDMNSDPGSMCTIRDIAYFYLRGKFYWSRFGTPGSKFRKLEGLRGLPKFANYSTVKLATYGGKLLVFWDKYVPSSGYKEKMIWCAEILIEKRAGEDEFCGEVGWFDAVLTVPKSYKFVYAIAVIV